MFDQNFFECYWIFLWWFILYEIISGWIKDASRKEIIWGSLLFTLIWFIIMTLLYFIFWSKIFDPERTAGFAAFTVIFMLLQDLFDNKK